MTGPHRSRTPIETTFEWVNEPSVIRYTTDGSKPRASSRLWDSTGPREPGETFHVNRTTRFRWIAEDIKGNVSTGQAEVRIGHGGGGDDDDDELGRRDDERPAPAGRSRFRSYAGAVNRRSSSRSRVAAPAPARARGRRRSRPATAGSASRSRAGRRRPASVPRRDRGRRARDCIARQFSQWSPAGATPAGGRADRRRARRRGRLRYSTNCHVVMHTVGRTYAEDAG